jgi:hypothetical protein
MKVSIWPSFNILGETQPFMNSFTSLCLNELSRDALMLQHLHAITSLICFLNSLRLNEPKFLWPWSSFPQPPPFLEGRRRPHVRPQQLSQGAAEGLLLDAFDHLLTEFHLSLCPRPIKIEDDFQQDHLRLQAMMRSRLVFHGLIFFNNTHKDQKTDVLHHIHRLDQGNHLVACRQQMNCSTDILSNKRHDFILI